jgi:cytochrome c-type biogenesis protein CcmH/NrfG
MEAAQHGADDSGLASPPPADAAAMLALRRFAAQRAVGDFRAALKSASDACDAAPNRPEPHYAYGEAWLAIGEPGRAAQAFAAAVRLKPTWPDAWINLGLARYRHGAIGDAKTAMRQALRRTPDHPTAIANLAAFMRITGEGAAAEALLRGAIARDPANVAARLNLAAALLQEERPEQALALLDAAPSPPDDRRALSHWRLQRSHALLQQDRPAEARTELEALASLGPIPPELAPLWLWRRVLLAQAEHDSGAAIQAARRMEAALDAMGSEAVPEHRIMGHYDLAKFWSGVNQQAASFAHWRAGHALLAPMQPFSRDAHCAFIDANIKVFDRARFARGPRASNADPAPVFIVGMPRSGTTLTEQILGAHADAHAAGERSALGQAFAALGGDGAEAVGHVAALDAAALETAASRYLAELHALAPDKARIVDKMPGNYLYLGLAGLMLPGARIIHCVRDPRDVGLSIWTFRFHGAHGYAHDLADLGWTIAEQARLMAHWKAALPNRVLTLALADWVADFDATLARVLIHVRLPHDPACARFYERDSRVQTVSRAQVRQPVNARGLGRWRAYATELAPLIEELDRAGALAEWADAPPSTTSTPATQSPRHRPEG